VVTTEWTGSASRVLQGSATCQSPSPMRPRRLLLPPLLHSPASGQLPGAASRQLPGRGPRGGGRRRRRPRAAAHAVVRGAQPGADPPPSLCEAKATMAALPRLFGHPHVFMTPHRRHPTDSPPSRTRPAYVYETGGSAPP
jgi:hypothetical protein